LLDTPLHTRFTFKIEESAFPNYQPEDSMKISRSVQLLAAFTFTLALAGTCAAGGMDKGKDGDTLQLREELSKDTRLSKDDMSIISKELDEYARRTQDREQIRELVRNSLDEGCQGECLAEVIDAMSYSVKGGMTPPEAQALVSDTLKKERMERKELSGKALGERVKDSVKSHMKSMDRGSDKDKDMKKDGYGGGMRY
jgi:hypothetical protein